MEEAQRLRTAMKGVGCDKMTIIKVVAAYNSVIRDKIAKQFHASFGMELEGELQKELSFNLQRIMVGAFKERYEEWADAINESIKGLGTNSNHII